jgi:hypothetical protein
MTDAFVLGERVGAPLERNRGHRRWVRQPGLRGDGGHGVLGVCVGSGQGVALVLENPSA